MELNIREALRYLGVRGTEEALLADMTALARELQNRITPRFTWRAFDLTGPSEFRIPDSEITSPPPSSHPGAPRRSAAQPA